MLQPERKSDGIPSANQILGWMYVGRVVVAMVVFAAAALSISAVASETILILAIAALSALIMSGASALHTHVRRATPTVTFLYVQALFDLALVTAIVHVTTGPESQFPALYILVIAMSAVLMPLGSSVLITALASLLYLADIVLYFQPVELSVVVWLQIGVFVLVFVATGLIGNRVRIVGVERRQLQQEVRRLRLEAADVLRNIQSGVLSTDGDGRIQATEAEGTVLANALATWDTNRDGALSRAEIWARRFGGEQVPPDIYYSDRAVVTLGGKTVELHYTGRNHTDDMTVVLFPAERTIYTVDFLTPKRPPRTMLADGFLPEWIESLRTVEQLDFDIISPGHELPGTKADVIEQRQYLEELVAAVAEGIAAGKTKEQLVETVLMEDYDHLIEYEFSRAGNVAGAYEILISSQ